MDVEETLEKVPLFRELKAKQLKSLVKWTTTRNFSSGQTIMQDGDSGVGLYCIQSGHVRVTKGDREIRTMGPGESFGELSLLDDAPRSATVTAIEPTTAVLLDEMQFLAELHTYPEIALGILPALVQWLREADLKIAELI